LLAPDFGSNHAVFAKCFYLRLRVAQSAQRFFGILAGQGSGRGLTHLRAGRTADRIADSLKPVGHSPMRGADHQAARDKLGILECVLGLVDRRHLDIERHKSRGPRRRALPLEGAIEKHENLRALLCVRGLVLTQFRTAKLAAQRISRFGTNRRERQISAIPCLVNVLKGRGCRAGFLAVRGIRTQDTVRNRKQREHAIEHREVHVTSFSRQALPHHRAANRNRGHHAGNRIRQIRAGNERRPVGSSDRA
jgi:hypothetical protein